MFRILLSFTLFLLISVCSGVEVEDAIDVLSALSFGNSPYTPIEFSSTSTAGSLHRVLASQYSKNSLVKDPSRIESLLENLETLLTSPAVCEEIDAASLETLNEHQEFRDKIGQFLLKLGRSKKLKKLREIVLKNVSLVPLLEHSLESSAGLEKMRMALMDKNSASSRVLTEQSRQNILDAISQSQTLSLVKRENNETASRFPSLTKEVIDAISNTENLIAPIVLALAVLPIAIVLDIAGVIISVSILLGIVLPVFLFFLVFVVPLLWILGKHDGL